MNDEKARLYSKSIEDNIGDQRKICNIVMKKLIRDYSLNFIVYTLGLLSFSVYHRLREIIANDKRYHYTFSSIFISDIAYTIVTRHTQDQLSRQLESPISNSELIALFSKNGQYSDIVNKIIQLLSTTASIETAPRRPKRLADPNIDIHHRQKIIIKRVVTPTFNLVSCFKEFTTNFFQFFSRGMLDNITWSTNDSLFKVVVGGGAVISSLYRNFNTVGYDKYAIGEEVISQLPFNVKQIIRNHMGYKNENHYSQNKLAEYDNWLQKSDIDLYLVCKDESIVSERIEILVKEITGNLKIPFKLLRTKHSVTILPLYPYRPIQIITTLLRDISDHILYCDLDCTSLVYDVSEKNVFTLERGVNSLVNRVNLINPTKITTQLNSRMRKYSYRGFDSLGFRACNGYPRCDAAFVNDLVYSTMSDKVSYQSIDTLPYGPNFTDIKSLELELNRKESTDVDVIFKRIYSVHSIKEVLESSPPIWRYLSETHQQCYQCNSMVKSISLDKNEPVICQPCKDLNISKWNQWNKVRLITKYSDDHDYFEFNRYALVTGGRTGTGFHTALRLLRSKCAVIITTRFPYIALEQYRNEPDSNQWIDYLRIYGIDFRYLPSVNKFIQYMKDNYRRLDILINNASQRNYKSTMYYSELYNQDCILKSVELSSVQPSKTIVYSSNEKDNISLLNFGNGEVNSDQYLPTDNNHLVICEHCKQPKKSTIRKAPMENITMEYIVESQLVNITVPFMLINQLSNNMVVHKYYSEYSYIVNVLSQEHNTKFDISILNASIKTLTSSISQQFSRKGILVFSVDPGSTPLSFKDSATRVLDPILKNISI